jgi:nucleotide-binding universal stress UspA family protein
MERTPRKILIAVDGSRHALDAVTYVARNCAHGALAVDLLHVMPQSPEEVFWQVPLDEDFMIRMKEKYDQCRETWQREARQFLDVCSSVLASAGFRKDSIRLILQEYREGVARDIIAQARKGYAAVVVGRRGLGKMESRLLGSVSNKVVEQVLEIPVWVIGGDIRLGKILLAVDASENSRRAADYVAGFARVSGEPITLYHVIKEAGLGFGQSAVQFYEDIEKELMAGLEKGAREMFSHYRARLQEIGIKAEQISTKCMVGSLGRAVDIIREAREGGYGTIVLGRRGISKIREFLMGRVTTKVLNGAEGLAVWIVP